jgi:hypothetical protein
MSHSKTASAMPDPGYDPAEFEVRNAIHEPSGSADGRFQPLRFCPPAARPRFERRAGLAAQHPLRAIELKCLDCCGWDRREAKQCEIASCPLWAMNQRIFGVEPQEAAQ